MSNLPSQTTPTYATDEDVAVRAGGDFVTLCPAWQQMANGVDGAFAANARWTLTSATVDFLANGVTPNCVVQLTAPKIQFPGGGALLAVDTVAANTITLRRLHKDVGVGMPPAPAAGLSAVAFSIVTLGPQIEEVSFDIKRRFGIDETIVARGSSWIFDLRDLRQATILTVLAERYTSEARGDKGDFPRKIGLVRAQLADVIDRVQIRWGQYGASAEPTSVFSCKLTR